MATPSARSTTAASPGLLITGEQDASTWFGAVNLSATKWLDNNIGLTGRVGYSYSTSTNDAYIDSTATPVAETESDLGQLQVAGRVSYYTESVMPYIGLTYVHDVERERIIAAPLPSDDRDEFILNAGLSFFGTGAGLRRPRPQLQFQPRRHRWLRRRRQPQLRS